MKCAMLPARCNQSWNPRCYSESQLYLYGKILLQRRVLEFGNHGNVWILFFAWNYVAVAVLWQRC